VPLSALIAAIALLLGQASLPALQSLHERLESAPANAAAVAFGAHQDECCHAPGPAEPGHPPGHHHDESGCSICQTIAAARQSLFLPPPITVAFLERRPEPATRLCTPARAGSATLTSLGARGPPCA
jgi:hypothetical protein